MTWVFVFFGQPKYYPMRVCASVCVFRTQIQLIMMQIWTWLGPKKHDSDWFVKSNNSLQGQRVKVYKCGCCQVLTTTTMVWDQHGCGDVVLFVSIYNQNENATNEGPNWLAIKSISACWSRKTSINNFILINKWTLVSAQALTGTGTRRLRRLDNIRS